MKRTNQRSVSKQLARALPDVPRWVETRAMLLSGECEIFGPEESLELCFAVCDAETKLVSVVGTSAEEAIRQAVAHVGNTGAVLAPPETSDHVASALPEWKGSLAVLHVLNDNPRLPEYSPESVRLLAPGEAETIAQLPPDLRRELVIAARRSPIAATIVDGHPVSFCYAASQTESLWDVSIDTLADYRGRGYAAPCVSFMIVLMREERGKQPVWGAEMANRASMRLAAKLGFVPMDQLTVFQPPRR